MTNGFEGMDWQEKYGFIGESDRLFRKYPSSHIPRMPDKNDRDLDWVVKMRPKCFDGILYNDKAVKAIHHRIEHIQTKQVYPNVIFHGPVGSGKTSAVHLFVEELYPEEISRKQNVLCIDCSCTSPADITMFVNGFMKKKERVKTPDALFTIVLDHFQKISPKEQQNFRILIDGYNRRRAQFIIQCSPAAKFVVEKISGMCDKIEMVLLPKNQILHKLLLICHQERIGFTPPAMQKLLDKCSRDICYAIKCVYDCFQQYHYLSIENVRKIFQETSANKIQMDIIEMSQPVKRCRICTLQPPCEHYTLQQMFNRLERMRSAYPRDRNHLICPAFKRTGICTIFERKAKCVYDHPLDLHHIDTSKLVPRCKPHRLPLKKCVHCESLLKMQQSYKENVVKFESTQFILNKKTRERARIETQLYQHIRKFKDVAMWGSTKENYTTTKNKLEKNLKDIDLFIKNTKLTGNQLERSNSDLKQVILKGKTKGLGKGNG